MSQTGRAAAVDERRYLATVAGLVEQAWPAGVPREVRYPLGEIPVTEHLRHAARATPDKACVVYYGYRLSYAPRRSPPGVAQPSARVAGGLHQQRRCRR